MVDVRETPDFTNWLAALSDQRARLQIVRRIGRIAAGTSAMPSRSEVRLSSSHRSRAGIPGLLHPARQGRRHPPLRRRQADPEQRHSEGEGHRRDVGGL